MISIIDPCLSAVITKTNIVDKTYRFADPTYSFTFPDFSSTISSAICGAMTY
jgi:hypothetical protein